MHPQCSYKVVEAPTELAGMVLWEPTSPVWGVVVGLEEQTVKAAVLASEVPKFVSWEQE
jgi:hypothetical protein